MDFSTITELIPVGITTRLIQSGLAEATVPQKYYDWLDGRAKDYADRTEDYLAFGSKAIVRSWLHRSVIKAEGRCYYTGRELEWEHIGTKNWDTITAPSIDHDRESSQLEYRLTYIRLNRSKQDMTLDEWYALTDTVKKFRSGKTP